ncbi:hypothetical protein [Nocardia arthritidis]|uniref:Competence protein CoiA nuclease-like domain-containing protein n=1 Tax=Nocardia arthritidis TaxID=228602 RepID=A0A6G9YKA4_9NOCA|nr:hypothetical protein [Nocardia arthritidis]QIS13634.1 hypothetical protein F5544_28945 [Nocardia arthritidis]
MAGDFGGSICEASEMTAALDHYGRFIDIRWPGAAEVWKGRKGLQCLVCRRGVEAYRSRRGNLFVRHEKTGHDGESHPTATGLETYLHKRLKYWVRDQLRARGVHDAEVEQHVGDQIPDVYGHRDGRAFAVEIQYSDLDYSTARERTQGLRAAGCEVLWLTRNCDWVEKLPALGVKHFDPPDSGYRAHIGYLAMNAGNRLRVQTYDLDRFFAQWIDNAVAWAYRDRNTGGWATVTDWEQHTKQQADTIGEQRRQLEAAAAREQQHDQDLEKAEAEAVKLELECEQHKQAHRTALVAIKNL